MPREKSPQFLFIFNAKKQNPAGNERWTCTFQNQRGLKFYADAKSERFLFLFLNLVLLLLHLYIKNIHKFVE